ncbi:MAG: hydrolase [Bacilli bacterium]|jgi:hypothetical protein
MEYKKPIITDAEGIELKNRFIKIFKELVVPAYNGADNLLKWIENSDFFVAPASTMYHLSCKYGLLKHSLNVYDRLMKIVDFEYKDKVEENLGVDNADLALIALCHDLCKAETYTVEMRNTKDASGNWIKEPYYKYSPKFEMGGHGQKSLFIVQQFITGLSLNVCSSIVYHMGASGCPNSPLKDDTALQCMESLPIVMFTNIADMEATFLDERREEK